MEKIKKIDYVGEVYEQLNAMICSGVITEGMKISSEMTLARELNVSRPVVREALQRLRAEHKIITYQGLGSFCANPLNYDGEVEEIGTVISEDEFREFQEFRRGIEALAIQLAAVNHTEKDLEDMRFHLERMMHYQERLLNAPGPDSYSREDEAFHQAIYAATHNSLLLEAYTAVRPRIFQILCYLNRHRGAGRFSETFHQSLYSCIAEGDGEKAVRLMKAHDEYNRARVAEYHKTETVS